MLDVIAWNIFPVLGELDRETVVRTLVHPGQDPFDQQAGFQFQIANLGEGYGIKVFLGFIHGFQDFKPV
jgi:hypothetical protein